MGHGDVYDFMSISPFHPPSFTLPYQVLNQADHQCFLPRLAFGHQQSQGDQGIVRKTWAPLWGTLQIMGLQVVQEKEAARYGHNRESDLR